MTFWLNEEGSIWLNEEGSIWLNEEGSIDIGGIDFAAGKNGAPTALGFGISARSL